MTSQQEIRPPYKPITVQYPSDVYVDHVLFHMEYDSYDVMIEGEGLLQRLMQNNYGHLRTDNRKRSLGPWNNICLVLIIAHFSDPAQNDIL